MILTITEIVCYLLAIVHMHRYSGDSSIFDEQAVLLLFIGLCITMSKQTYLYSLSKDSNVAIALGKYSGALFLGHFLWVQHSEELVIKLAYNGGFSHHVVGISIALAISFVIMILSDIVKKTSIYNFLLKKLI